MDFFKIRLTYVILFSLFASACGGGSNEGDDVPENPRIDQVVTIVNEQSVLAVGDRFRTQVTASGIGAIFYVSSNPDIATVTNEGDVEAVVPGTTVITVSVAGDHRYHPASTQYTLQVVPKSIEVSAWIGSYSVELHLSDEAKGHYLYRTTEENCDLSTILECEHGKVELITDNEFEDLISPLEQDIYYSLVSGDHNAKLKISKSDNNNLLNPGQVVLLDDKLWSVGHSANSENVMQFSIDAGRSWHTVEKKPEFDNRNEFSLVSFNNLIWLYAGRSIPFVPYEVPFKDIWSFADSNEQIWNLEQQSTPLSIRTNNLIEFENRLWMMGGYEWGRSIVWPTTKILNSIDGINWLEVSEHSFLHDIAYSSQRVTVYDDKIWLLSGGRYSPFTEYNVRSSSDGIEWITFGSFVAESDPDAKDRIIGFANKLWIFIKGEAGQDNHYLRSSVDGVVWEEEITNLPVDKVAKIIHFDGGLLAFAGQEVWFTNDPTQWKKGFSGVFDFSPQ